MNQELYARFDIPVNRAGTECLKWDARADFGNPDALPMWVADMDFQTADGIMDALSSRVRHGVFGYSLGARADQEAAAKWLRDRHNCDVEAESVLFSPGVVDSIYHVLRALAPEGARAVIQPPVYGPFRGMSEKARMRVIENPLTEGDNGWEMNLTALEDRFKEGADVFILCSPHNPVGRVWRMDELTQLVSLCNQYHVRLISDEIHADFELRGAKHIPILSVPGAQDAVMLISATKTFNLAALRHSAIICPSPDIRGKIQNSLNEAMTDVNLFGRLATRAAYQTGADWLDALNEYLTDGRDLLTRGFADIPGIRANCPQGTYLMWLDARGLHKEGDALRKFFAEDCGVILSDGAGFGSQGAGFMRLNFATTHKNLEIALERIGKAVREA